MAEGINRVTLLGHLGADPDLRFTQAGQPVLSMRLATTESYLDKDRQRQERTDWHQVIVWGKRGEGLAKFLKKGAQLLVEGSIRTSSYDDRDGNKRYKTEIIASNVVLCGGGRGQREQAPSADARPSGRTPAPHYTGDGGSTDAHGGDAGGAWSGSDDEIPF